MKAEISWQDAAGRRWAELQERTDAQLGPLGRAALELVSPEPRERVLDVGCGAGQTTLELAELVGPNGSVVGLDISEPLLARARERVAASGHTNVELVLDDAAKWHFERPFDLIFSRFGVMFFEDPRAAFRHLVGALVPRGRLGFVCWQGLAQNPWGQVPLEAVRSLLPDVAPPAMLAPGAPGPFAFADQGYLRELLESAGLTQIRIEPRESESVVGAAVTVDETIDYVLQIGPAARFVADHELTEDPRVREVLRQALAPYVSERGVVMPSRTFVVSARRGS